jgi:hypothetical protein
MRARILGSGLALVIAVVTLVALQTRQVGTPLVSGDAGPQAATTANPPASASVPAGTPVSTSAPASPRAPASTSATSSTSASAGVRPGDGTPDWMRPLRPGENPPQFVLFSFDGAGSHDHWQRMQDISRRSNATFSAFLSGIYLLSDDQRTRYTGPGHAPGKASIGFGGSPEEVRTRIGDLNTARQRGIEIGTHYNVHFCRPAEPSVGRWDGQMWRQELDEFFTFVTQAPGLQLDPTIIKGGRTPCLEGRFDVLFPVLAERGMTYDSSRVSDGISWPAQESGVWEFPMPSVRVPALNKKVIMMDYNLWYSLNQARDDKSRRDAFADATLGTYRAAYTAALQGNRAPLVIGNHFNDWAGGAFALAVERFMPEVCAKPETICTTYSQVIKWMELQPPGVLEALRKQPNAQT